MSETKTEQIKRLQGNLVEFARISSDDRDLFEAIPVSEIEVLHGDGKWHDMTGTTFCSTDRHRIKSDYKPEPDTPVFEGYVLCMVRKSESGLAKFDYNGNTDLLLSSAIDFHCCGYVPKDKFAGEYIMNRGPVNFMDGTRPDTYGMVTQKELASGDYWNTTLGWVCFKEETK